ncbi:MAG: DUF5663 domain-containing protein [Candidatus Saccharimonadales bacterium]
MAIKLDDSLLEELGLGSLPEAEKKPFLRQLYEQLEKNVGTRLAAGMTDEQLNQFERFAAGDIAYASQYLQSINPNWTAAEDYATMYQERQAAATRAGAQFQEQAVVAEYAAFKWLEINFPNYKDVVADEFEKLKGEIKQIAPQILAASGPQASIAQGGFAPTASTVGAQPDSFAPAGQSHSPVQSDEGAAADLPKAT